MNRISTTYASTSSSTSYSPSLPSPFSRPNQDRDVVVQRTLLGENAYLDELETPSPIATPSPMIKQLSPLSQATHLNAAENPFLDSADYERDAISDRWPSASAVAPLKQHTRQAQHHRSLPRSSFMTSSGTGLVTQEQSNQDAHVHTTARQAPRNVESPSPAHLPTIQETAIRVSPPVPPRRRTAKPSGMNSYPLPPTTDLPRSSAQTPTWRRPSPFPLGPVPPPLPPRRIRTEPQPHIVDIAVEKFKINTHTLSYNPSPMTPTSSKSAQQEERERQWEKWETERIRAQQMTMEAAKNNRVFAPRSNASSSSSGSRTTTSTVASTVEKVKPAPTPVKKTKKRSFWCFGGGGVESDAEEEDEKAQYSQHQQQQQQSRRRSVASLDAIEVDEEEEDGEEESSDARASSHGTGLLRFSCSKSSSSRKGATLKKKTQ